MFYDDCYTKKYSVNYENIWNVTETLRYLFIEFRKSKINRERKYKAGSIV